MRLVWGQLGTVLRAEPMVVLGFRSGMLTVEPSIAAGELAIERLYLAAVFGS